MYFSCHSFELFSLSYILNILTRFNITLVNVYVALPVFTFIAGTLWNKNAVCLTDYRVQSFLSIQHVYGDFNNHLGTDSSTDLYGRPFFLNFLLLRDRILIWGTFLSLYPCTSHPLIS